VALVAIDWVMTIEIGDGKIVIRKTEVVRRWRIDFPECIGGPTLKGFAYSCCTLFDFDQDHDVDLRDFAILQTKYPKLFRG